MEETLLEVKGKLAQFLAEQEEIKSKKTIDGMTPKQYRIKQARAKKLKKLNEIKESMIHQQNNTQLDLENDYVQGIGHIQNNFFCLEGSRQSFSDRRSFSRYNRHLMRRLKNF